MDTLISVLELVQTNDSLTRKLDRAYAKLEKQSALFNLPVGKTVTYAYRSRRNHTYYLECEVISFDGKYWELRCAQTDDTYWVIFQDFMRGKVVAA